MVAEAMRRQSARNKFLRALSWRPNPRLAFSPMANPRRGIGSHKNSPRKKPTIKVDFLRGGPSGTRTHDTRLKRPLL
jgi:hypothetical protein